MITGALVGTRVGAGVAIALGLSVGLDVKAIGALVGLDVDAIGVLVGATVSIGSAAVLIGSAADGGDVVYKGPPTEEQSKMSSPLT